MAQDPTIGVPKGPQAVRATLAEAWNASHVGRYVKSHHISRTALIAAAFGVAVLFFAVGALLRLLVGPISLGPLSGQISDALAQALPGITVKYDQAAVEWSRDQGRVNLVVLGARVFDSRGRIVAQAPQADIDLAAQPFLSGKLVVTRITLVGVQLTMVRNVDGSLRLGVGHDEGQSDIISRITDAINKNSSSASTLESFAVRDARMAFMDETTGLFIVAPKADVRIANAGRDLVASLAADIEISGRPAHVTGELRLPPQSGPVRGSIAVQHLDVAALGRNARMFAFLSSVAMTADLKSDFAISGTHLLDAAFLLSGSGTAALVGVRGPVRVKTLRVAGRYDRSKAHIALDDATLESDRLHAHVMGGMDFIYDRAGAVSRLGVDLTADRTALEMPGTFAQPIFLPLVRLKGSYDPVTHDILIGDLSTKGGALVLAASGRITLVDKSSPAMELKGRIEPLAVRDLLHYWPLDIGGGARDWIDRNIFRGTLGPIVFETHLPSGAFDLPRLPVEAVTMSFPIVDAELNYLQGLTHMTGVNAMASLTGNSFGAEVSRGRIGPLTVSKGHALIPDLSAHDSPGDIAAHVDGSMTDILKLTDLKPLNYATRFGLDPDATEGKAGIDLKFHVPMRRDLSVDDIAISVTAVTSGFGIALGRSTRLSNGAVTFAIDNTHLHGFGAVDLASSRMTIDWMEDFKAAGPVTTKVGIKGVLDQAARDQLGFHAVDYLHGAVGVTGTLTGHRGQLLSGDLALDLTPATLAVDLANISKPAGFPASGHALLTFGAHSALRSADVTIAGPSLQGAMTLAFDEQGTLASLNAPTVKSGTANDFSFAMTRGPAGLDIALRGKSLDGTKLAGRGNSVGAKPAAATASGDALDGPFHIDAKLDRVVLRNAVAVAPLALDVTGIGERPATMTLSGHIGKTGTLAGSIAPVGNDRRLTLTSNDFGDLAHGVLGFGSIKGGDFDMRLTLHGPAAQGAAADPAVSDYEGQARLKDFRLLNQPFLARLFSAGSLIGFGNLMQGGGIQVDDLKVPFSAKNGVLAIHDARASGPAIGISAEGYIDRPKNDIELKGTLVPLFGLNSVLGIIPLVGDLLISKPGEGIIGMVYTVSGDADEPKITINPLSLVTPGILRRVFEGKMPDAANAPSNNAPATGAAPPAPAPKPP